MGGKRPYKPRKPGAGRKPLKPNYDAAAILQEHIQDAVVLYEEDNSLQTIADTLSLNPIKVRKLLITAGVYESEIADAVNSAFEEKQGMSYKEALEAVAAELNLSKASVTSYLEGGQGKVMLCGELAESGCCSEWKSLAQSGCVFEKLNGVRQAEECRLVVTIQETDEIDREKGFVENLLLTEL